MSVIQEHGFFSSQFRNNGLQFTNLDCLCEKIDNSIDAGKRSDADFKVDVVFSMISGTKDGYYYDNVGMSETEMVNYRNLHRASNHREMGIGKHGLGGKQADYQLSSKGETHIISRKDGVYHYMKFGWNQMGVTGLPIVIRVLVIM